MCQNKFYKRINSEMNVFCFICGYTTLDRALVRIASVYLLIFESFRYKIEVLQFT